MARATPCPHTGSGSDFVPVRDRPVWSRFLARNIVLPFLLGVGGLSTFLMSGAAPANASSRVNTPRPIGTTFAFPDTTGAVVDISLLQVVDNAPARTHYKGLHGKGPVIGLEFSMKNISAKSASLALFSSVLYYSGGVATVTRSDGATKLGPSLNLGSSMGPGSHRQGWITSQGDKKKLLKIQATLNGVNTGSWQPSS
jgi:hypothetical protein